MTYGYCWEKINVNHIQKIKGCLDVNENSKVFALVELLTSYSCAKLWPINVINSVDKTKMSCYTPLLMQHHSFFRNLPPPPKKKIFMILS